MIDAQDRTPPAAGEPEFESILDSLPHLLWVAGPSGDTERANERYLEYAGRASGWGWERIVHPDDGPAVAAAWSDAVRTGDPLEVECRLRRHDGAYRWHVSRARPQRGPDGVVHHWVGTCTEVDERKRDLDEARAGERLYRAIVEATPECVKLVAADGRLLQMNPAGLAMIEADTLAAVVGRSVYDLIAAEHRGAYRAYNERVCRGEGGNLEFDILGLRGGRRHMEATSVPLPADGGFVHLAVTRDVTDRERVETALRREQEFVRLVLDTDPNLIFVKDADGRFVLANRALADLYGTTTQALVGRRAGEDLPAPAKVPEYRRVEQEVLRTGRPVVADEVNTRPDGRVFWFHTIKVPLVLPDGTTHVLGIAADVTAQKQAEEAMQQARQRLTDVVASCPAVLFTLGIEGDRIRGINWITENLREWLGYRPDEAFAADWWPENIHPEERAAVVAQTQRDLLTHGYAAHEYRFRHRDGSYRWTRGEIRLLRDAAGRPAEAVGAWTDVTDHRQLEDQVRQSQKMEAVGLLAGGVAHDFNNLLTVINGYSDILLQRLPADDPLRKMVGEIRTAGERSAGLTRQLLAFSRKQILQQKVLDLGAVVAGVSNLLRRVIGEDVELVTAAGPGLMRVTADPGQIEQVVLNLATNARDAMPTGGRLTIEFRNATLGPGHAQDGTPVRPGPYVVLAVSDTGCGMTDAVKSRIFEPFFTTKEVGRGTGLGLAMVYGIVKQSGGHIDVETHVGTGTTFRICLPATSTPVPVAPPVVEAPMPRGTETILLVEDEVGVRAMTRQVLVGCGYTVLEAADGVAALQTAAGHAGPIHLLATDVVLPGIGGPVTAARVAERHPEVRVLYLSGYTDDAVVRHGVAAERVNFLQKPYTPATLAGTVRNILDAPR